MEKYYDSSPNTPNFVPEDKQKDVVKKFIFHGNSSDLFTIYIVNALLTVVTLGLYYPWAKAKLLQYNYGETEFMGSRFIFHGTGKEIFKGFIRAVLVLGFIYGVFMLLQYLGMPIIGALIFYVCFMFVIPLIVVGTVRYRASRSSWRGMYFQYVGTVSSMYKVMGLGMLYTVLTFGIYFHWLKVDIYKEVLGNLRLGNIKFKFTGDGSYYFGQIFFGTLLMYITLGIYYFRMSSNIFNYSVSNIRLHQDDYQLKGTLKAETRGMDMFELRFVNILIIVFSLGLATPVAIVRTMNFYANHITIRGNVDFNSIEQKDVNLNTGSGAEGFFDAFDMDLQLI
jgi:uncharacterized membrane protein YjgN (DUF898 family)